MSRKWLHSRNVFQRITQGSFILSMSLARYHDSVLDKQKADPFILQLFNTFHTLFLAFAALFDTWKMEEGSSEGKTLNLTQLLKLLSQTKIREWDVIIQGVHDQTTPRYKELLPNRRNPFQKGKQEEIIAAVNALSQAIGTETALADLKTDVDAFFTQLQTALAAQKGTFGATKDITTQLEAARVAMCDAMFSNLGALIQKYPNNPDKIEQYFDMKLISSSQQTFFTGTIKPLELTSVMKRTFNAGDEVVLTNLTNATLKFYLAKLRGDLPGTKFVELPKGEQTITADQLGDLSDPFLMVMNMNGDIWGKYEIEIV